MNTHETMLSPQKPEQPTPQLPTETIIFSQNHVREQSTPTDYPPLESGSVDPYTLYMREVDTYPLLTKAQEQEMGKSREALQDRITIITQKDSLSKTDQKELDKITHSITEINHTFTTANLKWVVTLATPYKGKGLPFMDLIQEGNLGLMRAVEKFDYRKGFSFANYASLWIKQKIERAIKEKSRIIDIPVYKRDIFDLFKRAHSSAYQIVHHSPSRAEIAERMREIDPEKRNWSAEDIEELLIEMRSPISTDKPKYVESEETIGDTIPDPHATSEPPDSTILHILMRLIGTKVNPILHNTELPQEPQKSGPKKKITQSEIEVLICYLGIADGIVKTKKETADTLNKSQKTIGFILENVREKLTIMINSGQLEELRELLEIEKLPNK